MGSVNVEWTDRADDWPELATEPEEFFLRLSNKSDDAKGTNIVDEYKMLSLEERE